MNSIRERISGLTKVAGLLTVLALVPGITTAWYGGHYGGHHYGYHAPGHSFDGKHLPGEDAAFMRASLYYLQDNAKAARHALPDNDLPSTQNLDRLIAQM
ncbi:MAG: hypothetical protein ABFS24_10965 [Pseudomonadota bacterium]